MAEHIIEGTGPGEGKEFAEEVEQFRQKYERLLGELARCGTEVSRTRTLEKDVDIAPHNFVRDARHVFVIPPQDVDLGDVPGEEVGVIPGTAPHTLTREVMVAEFDPKLVTGSFEVLYDDSGNTPELRMIDLLEDRELDHSSSMPSDLWATVGEVFDPFFGVVEFEALQHGGPTILEDGEIFRIHDPGIDTM